MFLSYFILFFNPSNARWIRWNMCGKRYDLMKQINIFVFYIIWSLKIYKICDINLLIIIFWKPIMNRYEVNLIFLMLEIALFYVSN